MFQDLESAYRWLEGQVNYEAVLGQIAYGERVFELEGFRQRLAAIGNPHLALRTIHIAGTRGKGSAALALEALLRASGLRTAVFTSPHIREYRERIRIDGEPLAGEVFCEGLAQVAQTGQPEPRPGTGFKTVFETLTALFFWAARRYEVDWAVVETGLGGRLDATNVVEPGPVLLTRIGLEHTHLLGDTIEAIAGEKAAILKPGGWAVAGAQAADGVADGVFLRRAASAGADLTRAEELCPLLARVPHPAGTALAFQFEGEPLHLESPLLGASQAENLQNSLAMLTQLRRRGLIPLASREAVSAALGGLRLPGRMERVSAAPEVYVDAAHCPTGAWALARTMQDHFGSEPAGLVLGMMADKDHDAFVSNLRQWGGVAVGMVPSGGLSQSIESE